MQKTILFLFLSILIFACSLNADQEKSLNQATVKYMFAMNNDLFLSKAAATHPLFLRYYKNQGTEKFKSHFATSDSTYTDPVIGTTETKGDVIHIQLKVALVGEMSSEKAKDRISVYAVSEDAGKNWFFIDGKDYESKICKKFKRLIQ